MSLDAVVVGSGVAGLSIAVRLADAGVKVGVVTKAALSETTTRWAQGGVAAVLHDDEDSTDLHLADTLRAGAGLCDVDAVRVLVDEGPARVEELIALGAVFDREATGSLQRAREGGHSHARILHAGGAATGAEVERALVAATQGTVAEIREHAVAVDLLVEDGTCRGLAVRDGAGRHELEAASVVLATGGAGQLFEVTTNPTEATGDGLAIAVRAGVPVVDVEFMQFHPTALHHPAMPRPLLSEALRGHGALLRNAHGERFVDELAPRHVVSRAMAAEMARDDVSHLWLDATGLDEFAARFPTIAASLASAGLDPATDWLPIAPAAHHLAGGIATDLDGATAMPGLFAVGEVACTGVHGANRLASNSLLEGMVFAARATDAVEAGRRGPRSSGAMRAILGDPGGIPVEHRAVDVVAAVPAMPGTDVAAARRSLQRAMTRGAGVVRSESSLHAVRDALAGAKGVAGAGDGPRARRAREPRHLRRGPPHVGDGPHRVARLPRPRGVPRRRRRVAPTARADGATMSADPPVDAVVAAVSRALQEDLGASGDLTGLLLDASTTASAAFVAREHGVLAGEACAREAFLAVDPSLDVRFERHDGDRLAPGDAAATVTGSMRSIVAAERTALNFLCHLSGIATATRALVDAVAAVDPSVKVLDTRKTTPGLRALEKAAVRAGGGTNHRSSLSESVLLKDNHLGVLGIAVAVERARAAWPGVRVQVECDTASQVDEALAAGADAVLLDNMAPALAASCVVAVRASGRDVFVEASGRLTVENAPAYAAAGVDAVSSGGLTHSVRAFDLGLDLREG